MILKEKKGGMYLFLSVILLFLLFIPSHAQTNEELRAQLEAELLNITNQLEAIDNGTWVNYSMNISYVIAYNYSCNETGSETSKVLTEGKHHLMFEFDGDTAYANNLATGLECNVTTVGTCDKTEIFWMSNWSNAHVEYEHSDYPYAVCCNVTGDTISLSTSTVSGDTKLLGFSSSTNAHAEKPDVTDYTDLYFSMEYGSLSCDVYETCPADHECVVTISDTTDAHVSDCDGDSDDYPNKVCCGFSNIAPEVLDISLTPEIPMINDDLNCSFRLNDNNATDNLNVTWYWISDSVVKYTGNMSVDNGTWYSTILDSANTSAGDSWTCKVVPGDDLEKGRNSTVAISVYKDFVNLINGENMTSYTYLGGIYYDTLFNSSSQGIQLSDNDSSQEFESNLYEEGWLNMSGNVLLLHLNNDSTYSEHTVRNTADAVYDFSGSSNSGVLGNTTSGTDPTWISEGKLNGAFSFDGNDYINFANSPALNLGTSDFTISSWFKLDSLTGDQFKIIASAYQDSGNRWYLAYNTDNHYMYFKGRGGGTDLVTLYTYVNLVSHDTWHYVVLTVNNSNPADSKLYLDGSDKTNETYNPTPNININNTGDFRIGQYSDTFYFDGDIDELAVWKRILSADDIRNIYDMQKGVYASSGEYVSQVFDTGDNVSWDNISWYSDNATTGEVDLCSGGTASASSVYSTYTTAAGAFDGVTGHTTSDSTMWSNDASDTAWLQYEFAQPEIVNNIAITAVDWDGVYTRTPSSFNLSASNTGSFSGEETLLLTVENYDWTQGEIGIWDYPNRDAYTYYRIDMIDKEDPFGKSSEYYIDEVEMKYLLNTSVSLKTRTSYDNVSWSEWSDDLSNPSEILNSSVRYLQYKAELESTSKYDSPTLYSVNISFSEVIDYYPNVLSIIPAEGFNATSPDLLVRFNCSAQDGIGLANISLFSDWGGSWELKDNISVGGTSSYAVFDTEVPLGTYSWGCSATDLSGQSNWTDNRTINVVDYNLTSIINSSEIMNYSYRSGIFNNSVYNHSTFGIMLNATKTSGSYISQSFGSGRNVSWTNVTWNSFNQTNFTSDLCSGGTASASSVYSTYTTAAGAFDGVTGHTTSDSTMWSNDASDTAWLQYEFAQPEIVNNIAITAVDWDVVYNRTPSSFNLSASNTGSFSGEETLLMTVDNYVWSQGEIREWNFSNSQAYNYYRIDMIDKEDPFGKSSEYYIDETEMRFMLDSEITVKLRTSYDNDTWSEWSEALSNPSGMINGSASYIQYKVDFNTNEISVSPALYSVIINFSESKLPPVVSLNFPGDSNNSIYYGYIAFNCSVTDNDGNLANISLYSDYNGSWQLIETKELTGTSNSTIFTRDIYNEAGKFIDSGFAWNCLAFDADGQSGWSESNYTFSGWNLGVFNRTRVSGMNITLSDNDSSQEFESNLYEEGWLNMSDNVLLLHLNNDSTYSEHTVRNTADAVYDFSGSSNSGVLGNTTSGTDPTWISEGKLNGAFSFDGNDYINFANSPALNLGTSDFTISSWFKLDSLTGDEFKIIVSSYQDSGNRWYLGYKTTDHYLYFKGRGDNADLVTLVTDINLVSQDTWHHVVLTVNNSNPADSKLYLDGADKTNGTYYATPGTDINNTGDFRIGQYDDTFYFDGDIDELAIWKKYLSADEILKIYEMQARNYTLEGEYTSQVFDAGSIASFDNISMHTSLPYEELPDNTENEEAVKDGGINMTGNVLLMHLDDGPDGISRSLDYNQEGNWDLTQAVTPSVLKDDNGIYHMWYAGLNGSYYRILYANSTNGTTWNTPVQSIDINQEGSWDTRYVYHPSVLMDENGIFHMWYSGYDNTNIRILYSNSTDGIEWTSPVRSLDYNQEGNWDTVYAFGPTVIKDGDVFKMWYSGYNGSDYRILYTYSTNGTTWKTPVQSLDYNQEGTWDKNLIMVPTVLKDGTYKMWYAGYDGSNYRILFTTSVDGINWDTPRRLLDLSQEGTWDTNRVLHPTVIREGDAYRMWYTGHDGTNSRILHTKVNFIDDSGMGNDGIGGNITNLPSKVTGRLDNAFEFDGRNDSISIPDNLVDMTDDFSVSVWLKPVVSTQNPRVISMIDATENFQLGWMASTGQIYSRISDSVEKTEYNFDGNYNQWYHIVYTKTSGTNHIYVNGHEKSLISGGISSNATFSAIGGGYSETSYLTNGSIDEVAIWNRSLSSDEILNIYKRGALRLNIQARTSDDNSTWSDWSENLTNPSGVLDTSVRYIQYKALLETDDGNYTPMLNSINISYSGDSSSSYLIVDLFGPIDGFNTTNTSMLFNWSVNSSSADYVNCTLLIDGMDNVTEILSANNSYTTYVLSDISPDDYNWSVKCNDTQISNTSETRGFVIIKPPSVVNITQESESGEVNLVWENVSTADSYEVYIADDWEDGFSSTANVTGLTDLNWTDTSTSDVDTRYYKVTSVRGDVNSTSTVVGVKKYPLDSGWNLVTLPFNVSVWQLNNGTNNGLNFTLDMDGCISSIYYYNTTSESWLVMTYESGIWIPATGSENFTTLEPGKGYWFETLSNCNISHVGIVPEVNSTIPLTSGYNMVGWYSPVTATLGQDSVYGNHFVTEPSDCVSYLHRYNADSDLFESTTYYAGWGWWPPRQYSSFTTLEPGRAYWLTTSQGCNWVHDP